MIIALCWVIGVLLWLVIGYFGGTKAAPLAYDSNRRSYPSLAKDNPYEGVAEAKLVMALCFFGGPLGWIYPLIHSGATKSIPAVQAVRYKEEAKLREIQISDMQKEIDRLHKDMGLPPLKLP